jgi:hypothetical protein
MIVSNTKHTNNSQLRRFLGKRIGEIVTIIGSIMFLVATFMPITTVFVVNRDIAEVQRRSAEWAASLALSGLGSAVTAIGLGLLTLQLHGSNTRPAIGSSYIGLAAIVSGTLCWAVIIYLRSTLPLVVVFSEPTFGWWYTAYTLFMQTALIAYGVAFLQAKSHRWLGVGIIVMAKTLLIVYLSSHVMPPLAHYALTLLIGIALLLGKKNPYKD